MAFFSRVSKAAISPPPGKAAAAAGAMFSPSEPSGAGMVGQYWSYFQGYDRQKAVSVAAVSRSIDLMKSVVSTTPLRMFGEMWDEKSGDIEEIPLAPRSWLKQPDPTVPYSFIMGWTLDDLFFTGSAFGGAFGALLKTMNPSQTETPPSIPPGVTQAKTTTETVSTIPPPPSTT